MAAPFGGKSMQTCRKPVPNTTDRQLKTLNGDEPQRAKRSATLPPHRRRATLPPPHRAAAPHRIALPPIASILSLHNPVIQRE